MRSRSALSPHPPPPHMSPTGGRPRWPRWQPQYQPGAPGASTRAAACPQCVAFAASRRRRPSTPGRKPRSVHSPRVPGALSPLSTTRQMPGTPQVYESLADAEAVGRLERANRQVCWRCGGSMRAGAAESLGNMRVVSCDLQRLQVGARRLAASVWAITVSAPSMCELLLLSHCTPAQGPDPRA